MMPMVRAPVLLATPKSDPAIFKNSAKVLAGLATEPDLPGCGDQSSLTQLRRGGKGEG
jgi:hypothetical protein